MKDYGADNQIGFNDSYENYINALNLVWSVNAIEFYIKVADFLCININIGDQFAISVIMVVIKVTPYRKTRELTVGKRR